mmetsp:Transcript_61748/g.122057  ORF Transcript_61748/g.122057 Transcript_61748/m.122057 type:complete len:326 (-) Transcript_61748:184-1161(-)
MRRDTAQDKNGNLDVSEIQVAFKRALAISQDVQARSRDAMSIVTTWQQRSVQAKDLADQTQEYEDEKKRLASIQNGQGQALADQLGSFFSVSKGNGVIGDTLTWDVDGDGMISKEEFAQACKAAGFRGIKSSAINELYESVSGEQNGEIDLEDLKDALKQLQNAGARAATGLADEKELLLELEEMVSTRQAKFEKVFAEDTQEKKNLLDKMDLTDDKLQQRVQAQAEAEKQAVAKEKSRKAPQNKTHIVADSVFRKVCGPRAQEMSLEMLSDYLVERGDVHITSIVRMFEEFDTDNSGTISKEEWRVAFMNERGKSWQGLGMRDR